MITYLKEKKVFRLSGKGYDYIMRVNDAGFLQFVYYGAPVGEDQDYFASYGDMMAPDKRDWNFDMRFDDMPSEYGFFGHGDFHEASALIRREDGGLVSRFRYASYKKRKGVPEVPQMPHVRKGGETLSITLKDDFSDTEIVLNYNVDDESSVLVRNAEIKNVGTAPVTLEKAFSYCLVLPDNKFSVMRLHGTWGAERTPEVTPLGHGVTRIQSTRGTSSHHMNPFMGLLRKGCTEESGECYGIELIYSGSFAMTCEEGPFDTARVQGGINDYAFGWKLNGGETFVTPQAALSFSDGGLGKLSRGYTDFLRDRVVNPAFVFKKRPVVVNNWEATTFFFDNEALYAIIDEAAKLGVDTFVLDDGWFGKRNNDDAGLGDWVVNEEKLVGGLHSVIDRCKQRGLKFGLWFEPEMVNEDSDLYRAHPDWAIHKDGVALCRSRNQLVLDFSRKEVVDYIFESVSKILREHDIAYVKWDMNRNLTENFSAALPADRQGELHHRFCLGVYDLAERLTSAFPKVFFEGCSSGGGRFDSGMLYYFPQIWTSDDTDAYERSKIQWGTSICYPVSSMSCHVSVCPNMQTARTTPFSTRGVVASLGAMGYELDLSKVTEEEKQLTIEQIKAYRKMDELVLRGDLYRLLSPFTEEFFAEMLVSKDKTRAYVAGMRLRGTPLYKNRLFRLAGLDPEKTYRVEELGVTAKGATLMNFGLLLPRIEEYESWAWNLTEIQG